MNAVGSILPVNIRKTLELKQGDELVVSVKDGAVVLEPKAVVAERVRSRVPENANAHEVDDFIQERREAAQLESQALEVNGELPDLSKRDVLDASALLAWLFEEGAEQVDLSNALMNTVNLSETFQKAVAKGINTEGLRDELESLGLYLEAFSVEEVLDAADLYSDTRSLGLSLGDRACLATAKFYGGRVLTADQAWQDLNLAGINVQLIS